MATLRTLNLTKSYAGRTVVRGVNLDYVKRHPGPGNVGLLVRATAS